MNIRVKGQFIDESQKYFDKTGKRLPIEFQLKMVNFINVSIFS